MSKEHTFEIYGMKSTERLFDAESFEEDTHINLPHEEAIEDAKKWIDDNEL